MKLRSLSSIREAEQCTEKRQLPPHGGLRDRQARSPEGGDRALPQDEPPNPVGEPQSTAAIPRPAAILPPPPSCLRPARRPPGNAVARVCARAAALRSRGAGLEGRRMRGGGAAPSAPCAGAALLPPEVLGPLCDTSQGPRRRVWGRARRGWGGSGPPAASLGPAGRRAGGGPGGRGGAGRGWGRPERGRRGGGLPARPLCLRALAAAPRGCSSAGPARTGPLGLSGALPPRVGSETPANLAVLFQITCDVWVWQLQHRLLPDELQYRWPDTVLWLQWKVVQQVTPACLLSLCNACLV